MNGRMMRRLGTALLALAILVLLPVSGANAKKSKGSLVQLAGKKGCIIDKNQRSGTCGFARALMQPGPFMGSRAIQISPDGRQVYVASSKSNAIAVFQRNKRTGVLKQAPGKKGCVAANRARGCGRAIGLEGPNSIAISPDGKQVYATARNSSSVTAFSRDRKTGALTQLPGTAGCTSMNAIPGCATGRALGGADVVTVSPDGRNVYVGAFIGNAIATFNRDATTGTLTQPADDTGCLTGATVDGCATGLAMNAIEGLTVSGDGSSVYAAAATSNAVLVLARDPGTGALTQATDGSGCIVAAALAGCTTGREISGANALTTSPKDGQVYVTSLISSSATAFARDRSTGQLSQFSGQDGCAEWLGATGCTLGRAMRAPEGVAVSPDGANVYVAAYSSGGIAVLNRNAKTGGIAQKKGPDGCIATQAIAKCVKGRATNGLSSIAISPDGRFVYATAAKSNAINVFRRVVKG
jgi:DNA-binding beta-propeller fold protein YncE